jgi:NADPH:quinone reductase-like Zn-dependent oxidoreductase
MIYGVTFLTKFLALIECTASLWLRNLDRRSPTVRFQLSDELMFLKNRKMPQKHSTTLMKGQVVVITGATSGVGYQAVQQLAKGQAHIVMINRNAEKSAKLQQQVTI